MSMPMLEAKERRIKVKQIKNYGYSFSPSYTIHLGIEIRVKENPDAIHNIMAEKRIISRETIPSEVVSNFRGSADHKPYYSSLIIHEGEIKRYKAMARDTGGFLRRRINYESVVLPEELRFMHPVDFSRLDIKVLEWELHNYKHPFMLFISSKRYESFDMWVKAEALENITLIKINLKESALGRKEAPCLWYLKRLTVFRGFSLEEEVRREVR